MPAVTPGLVQVTPDEAHVFADQFRRGCGSLIGGRTVVGVNQLDVIGLAADFNRGGFLVGVLHTQHFLFAARAGVAGGRLEHADPHHVAAGSRISAGSRIAAGLLRVITAGLGSVAAAGRQTEHQGQCKKHC